uniref:Uncharacterized protein n=1 Tax=Anguilla anguilla TaxID=7936 RepID=A0A0E9TDY8_ANGAN
MTIFKHFREFRHTVFKRPRKEIVLKYGNTTYGTVLCFFTH